MFGIYGKVSINQVCSRCELNRSNFKALSNENNRISMVCSGEIYNFQELRDNLKKKGHLFRSGESAEVIIHLYEELGIVKCVNQLRGTFAFAIWDENRQRLILARDHLGQKPLNYILQDGNLIFASEMKTILQDSAVKREVDLAALHNYLTYQYVYLNQETFFLKTTLQLLRKMADV